MDSCLSNLPLQPLAQAPSKPNPVHLPPASPPAGPVPPRASLTSLRPDYSGISTLTVVLGQLLREHLLPCWGEAAVAPQGSRGGGQGGCSPHTLGGIHPHASVSGLRAPGLCQQGLTLTCWLSSAALTTCLRPVTQLCGSPGQEISPCGLPQSCLPFTLRVSHRRSLSLQSRFIPCRTSGELAGTGQFLKALFPHRCRTPASSHLHSLLSSSHVSLVLPRELLRIELLPGTRGIGGPCQPGCHLPAPPPE